MGIPWVGMACPLCGQREVERLTTVRIVADQVTSSLRTATTVLTSSDDLSRWGVAASCATPLLGTSSLCGF